MKHYNYTIEWSDEDKVYITRIKEWSSIVTHGFTPEDSLAEMKTLLDNIDEE